MAPMTIYLRAAKHFLCGQVVSLFSLIALIMAKRLVYRDVNTPILLNAFFYVFMSMTYLLCDWAIPPVVSSLDTKRERGTIKWWIYPALAIIDVQANVCATMALQYTTFATTGLTLNLTVPFVFILSVCLFRTTYKWQHCLGCFMTLVGGVVLAVACYNRQALGSEQEVYGWSLAALSAMLYAGSTVLTQWCVQQRGLDSVLECLGKVGAWGALFCLIQSTIIERAEIAAIEWNWQVLLLFVGYVLCMFAFYTAVYVLVESTESMLYNVSVLCSSVYLMLLAHHSLNESLDMLTWAGMMIILVGLALYVLTRHPVDGATGGLPQINFKSIHSPRDLVPNKLHISQV